LTQPAHLARLSQTGSGLGRSTDPAQPPHSLSSPPRAHWRNLNRRHRRPANPVISGGLRRRCLGPIATLVPSTTYSNWNRRELPLRGDLGGFPSVSAAIDRLRFGASPSLLFCACCATSGACDARVLAGGSAVVWCSRCELGEVILG
jgi:hypothetical protein